MRNKYIIVRSNSTSGPYIVEKNQSAPDTNQWTKADVAEYADTLREARTIAKLANDDKENTRPRACPNLKRRNTMKAITTKYIGPTNHRGSRVSASDGYGNKVTISYDHASRDPHDDAAVALCRKMCWTGKLISGSTKNGNVYVFLNDGPLDRVIDLGVFA